MVNLRVHYCSLGKSCWLDKSCWRKGRVGELLDLLGKYLFLVMLSGRLFQVGLPNFDVTINLSLQVNLQPFDSLLNEVNPAGIFGL